MASTGRKKTASKNSSAAKTRSKSQTRNKTAGRTSAAGKSVSGTSGASGKRNRKEQAPVRVHEPALNKDIHILVAMAVALLLFLSMLGLCGTLGRFLSSFLFGVFGTPAFAFPFLLVYLDLFLVANDGVSPQLIQRVCGLTGLYIFVCAFFQLTMSPA